MLMFASHNLNLCSDSRVICFLWNAFEAIQKTFSMCFTRFKNTQQCFGVFKLDKTLLLVIYTCILNNNNLIVIIILLNPSQIKNYIQIQQYYSFKKMTSSWSDGFQQRKCK